MSGNVDPTNPVLRFIEVSRIDLQALQYILGRK
jgi:hypothetical protein